MRLQTLQQSAQVQFAKTRLAMFGPMLTRTPIAHLAAVILKHAVHRQYIKYLQIFMFWGSGVTEEKSLTNLGLVPNFMEPKIGSHWSNFNIFGTNR